MYENTVSKESKECRALEGENGGMCHFIQEDSSMERQDIYTIPNIYTFYNNV